MYRIPLCLFFVFLQSPLCACLWDVDTLSAERRAAPGILELITGKFVRHSTAYYEWRIEDRLQKLEFSPENLTLLDDLGVGYDKTGQHDLAIQTAKRALALDPDRYETHANLGIFLIHNRQMEEGLVHIKRAIEINPEAHFGREIIQQYLVEYVSHVWEETPGIFPLITVVEERVGSLRDETIDFSELNEDNERRVSLSPYVHHYPGSGPRGFAAYIRTKTSNEAALKGIAGMMRFGNHDSPVLLEALGDLLSASPIYSESHRHLAARAYLKASYAVTDTDQRDAYRMLAEKSISMQSGWASSSSKITLEEIEERFLLERSQGEDWFASLQKQEAEWIQSGQNVDTLFLQAYGEEPPPVSSPEWKFAPKSLIDLNAIADNTFLFLLLVVPLLMLLKNYRTKVRS